jgi:hypothetical protein
VTLWLGSGSTMPDAAATASMTIGSEASSARSLAESGGGGQQQPNDSGFR